MRALRDWLRWRDRDRDRREEFETHLALETERQIANGLSRKEAAAMAQRKFGNALRYREEMADLGWRVAFERLWTDIRHAARSLGHRPLATGAAVVALAFGMGGPTVVLTMLANISHAVYPQIRDPGSLVVITETPPRRPRDRQPATSATWRVWQPMLAQQTSDVSLAQLPMRLSLSWSDLPEPVVAQPIATTLLPLLGVAVQKGRGFVESDALPGAPPVAVISDTFWWTRFGAADEAVGERITVDGTPRTIVGVMPRAFWVTTRDVDVWVPIPADPAPDARFFVVGRLLDEDSGEALAKRLEFAAPQVAAANAGREAGWRVRVTWLGPRSILDDLLQQPGVLMLIAAAVLALLVACANVAMLMVARGAARQKETAVRSAVGAPRSRLIRQFLLESTMVSIAGGTLTLFIVFAVLRLVFATSEELALGLGAFRVDWRVIGGVLAVAALVGAVSGVAPAVADSRVDLMAALKETGFFSAPTGVQRLRRLLVTAEVALTVMLVASVGLLVRGVTDLERVPPGFDPERLLTVNLQRTQHLSGPSSAPPSFLAALTRIREVPNVESAAAVLTGPPGLGQRRRIAVHGTNTVPDSTSSRAEFVNAVSDDYFATLGLPVLAGRVFDTYETREAAPASAVAVVSRMFAQRYWPGAPAIGQIIRIEGEEAARTVVGVVGDQLLDGGRRLPAAIVFVPFANAAAIDPLPDGLRLLVRISGRTADVALGVRKAVANADPLQTVQVSAVKDVIAIGAAEVRVGAVMASPLMLLALLLTFSGVYGLLAQNVAHRTRELAVRLTLGAGRGDLFRLVVRDGLAMSAIGAAVGVAGALAVDRFLNAFLLSVPGEQPFALAASALAMMLATVLAALVPYRRALRIDPGRTLRYE
jgi:predicted permease